MSFADYKKNRQQMAAQLTEKLNSETKGSFEDDPNDWYPGADKAGNGEHLIRFLPRISLDDTEYVRWWSHSFQDLKTKKYYIENSRTSLKKNEPDPCGDFNRKLWESVENSESAKDHPNRMQATRQSRKLNYRANIYVIEDSINPENNGKIKKFKFGKWCFDHIENLIKPKLASKKPGMPFDLISGANLKIEIFSESKGGKFMRNYNGSHFESAGPLGDDKLMEKIYNELAENKDWSVSAYLSDKYFKSYDELKKRLDEVVGFDTGAWNPDFVAVAHSSVNTSAGSFRQSTPKVEKASTPKGEDSENFFANLNKEGEDSDLPF